MNKPFSMLALALTLSISMTARAAILNAPFIPEVDSRFNAIEQQLGLPIGNNTLLSGATSVLPAPALGGATGYVADIFAKCVFGQSGGAIAAGTYTSSGCSIPARSIIKQAFIFTTYATTGTGTVALQCVSANDIFSAASFNGNASGSIVAGVEAGAAANMLKVAASCNPALVVGTGGLTGGTLELYLDYVPYQQ